MATKLSKRSKRIVLVNRDFQLRYTRAAIGVGILSTSLTAVVILYPLYVFEILRIPNFLPLPVLFTMGFACFINVGFLGAMGIIVTHKIAGPMYSLVKHIRLVGMGRFTEPIRLRENDELKFVVRNFNEMLDDLKNTTLTDIHEIDALIEKIAAAGTDEGRKAATRSAEKFKQRVQARIEKESE